MSSADEKKPDEPPYEPPCESPYRGPRFLCCCGWRGNIAYRNAEGQRICPSCRSTEITDMFPEDGEEDG